MQDTIQQTRTTSHPNTFQIISGKCSVILSQNNRAPSWSFSMIQTVCSCSVIQVSLQVEKVTLPGFFLNSLPTSLLPSPKSANFRHFFSFPT